VTVSANVGDWVEVSCDYSPGVCSEGGTGVVIAKSAGRITNIYIASVILNRLTLFKGLVTVKYIYGPTTVACSHDGVIGSSINGRVEASIGLLPLDNYYYAHEE
jgi:hypothetical protein